MKKRIVSLLLCMVMALSLWPMTAYAEDAAGSDDRIFVTDLAISAADGMTSNPKALDALRDAGYKIVCQLLSGGDYGDYYDINKMAGGHYIYLGQKLSTGFANNVYDMITGLLVYKAKKGEKPDEKFNWNEKTYKLIPESKYLLDSDGDLTQGTGGDDLYLYYTNDDAYIGAPVLTYMNVIEAGNEPDNYNKDNLVRGCEKDVNGNIVVHSAQNLNSGTSGYTLYLYQTYHTHKIVQKYDETGHWDACTECSYESPEKEAHKYDFEPLDNGYQHKGSCDCGYSCNEKHVDKDDNHVCDTCYTQLVAKVNGLYFDNFQKAWDCAAKEDQDTTISVLEDGYVNYSMQILRNHHTITITGAEAENQPVLKIRGSCFRVQDGTLVMDGVDVEYTGTDTRPIFEVSNGTAGLCIKFGNIRGNKLNSSVIDASYGATVNLSGGTITGAKTAISVSNSKKIKITDGTYHGCDCGLSLKGSSAAQVSGGTFESDNSCAVMVDSGSVVDILAPDCYFYLADSGEKCTIEEGATKITPDVTVKDDKAFEINITTEGNGTVESRKTKARPDEEIKLTPNPRPGNHFKEWQTSDVVIGEDGTFIMPEKNVSIKAVFEANEPVSYLNEKGMEQTVTRYKKLTDEMTTMTNGWYVVDGEVEINSRIETSGTVHLILKDGAMLKANEGIHVSQPDTMIVYGQSTDNPGTLEAHSFDEYYAAIGGNNKEDSGYITINSGRVVASGSYGAGIGGGSQGAGNVTINGGIVNAECKYYGAAIGGGYNGDGIVTINGGTISAVGDMYAGAIGGGSTSNDGKVTITGGTIDARGLDPIRTGENLINLIPGKRWMFEVKADNNKEIEGSPFETKTGIKGADVFKKEAHIKAIPEMKYHVTVIVDQYGKASANVEQAYKNEKVTLTATPDNGCHFIRWISEREIDSDGSFFMPDHDTNIIAEFEKCESVEMLPGKQKTCTQDGYKDCYKCSCGNLYEEETCQTLIEDYVAWIAGGGRIAAGHIFDQENVDEKYLKSVATCTSPAVYYKSCSVCGEASDQDTFTYGEKDPLAHGTPVTKNEKEATVDTEGYTGDQVCSACGQVLEKGFVIPKLTPKKGDVKYDEKKILNKTTDSDPVGSTFKGLTARIYSTAKTSITIRWKKVSGATAYNVYAARCNASGKKYKLKKVASVKAGKYSFKYSKLKKGTYYKFIVMAVKGSKTASTSKTLHIATAGGKYTNIKSLTLNKTKLSLKKGKTYTVRVKKKTLFKRGKKNPTHRKISYESSNKTVATVSSKGVIKGIKKGKCTIYVYAQDGAYKKVAVTVK